MLQVTQRLSGNQIADQQLLISLPYCVSLLDTFRFSFDVGAPF